MGYAIFYVTPGPFQMMTMVMLWEKQVAVSVCLSPVISTTYTHLPAFTCAPTKGSLLLHVYAS
jgi:hypothetical protein